MIRLCFVNMDVDIYDLACNRNVLGSNLSNFGFSPSLFLILYSAMPEAVLMAFPPFLGLEL